LTLWGIMQRMRGKELLYITPFVLGGCGTSSGQPIPPECVMPAIGIIVAAGIYGSYRRNIQARRDDLLREVSQEIDENVSRGRRNIAKKEAERKIKSAIK